MERRKVTLEEYVQLGRLIEKGLIDRQTVQYLIERRFQAAPPASSVREAQARRLFALRFGDVLGCTTFEQYLDARGRDSFEPVPQVPIFPETHLRLFGHDGLWLIDGRVVEKIGLTEYVRLVGLAYAGGDDDIVTHHQTSVKYGIRWMIGQDGYRNRGKNVVACRKAFQPFEEGMNYVEGVGVYGLDPKTIHEHGMDLPGSVTRHDRKGVLFVALVNGVPTLGWDWDTVASPDYGSATRGE